MWSSFKNQSLSSNYFILPVSSFSSLPDVSYGEHDREAGELWRSKTGRAAQFTATLGSFTVQFPLATTIPLRRHSPQGQGALRLQVSACGEVCYFQMFTYMKLHHIT